MRRCSEWLNCERFYLLLIDVSIKSFLFWDGNVWLTIFLFLLWLRKKKCRRNVFLPSMPKVWHDFFLICFEVAQTFFFLRLTKFQQSLVFLFNVLYIQNKRTARWTVIGEFQRFLLVERIFIFANKKGRPESPASEKVTKRWLCRREFEKFRTLLVKKSSISFVNAFLAHFSQQRSDFFL